jgi:hypothetical protein
MNESTKTTVVDKPIKPIEGKPIQPSASNNQRGIGVVELLFAASTIGAAVVVAALSSPKRPEAAGD